MVLSPFVDFRLDLKRAAEIDANHGDI